MGLLNRHSFSLFVKHEYTSFFRVSFQKGISQFRLYYFFSKTLRHNRHLTDPEVFLLSRTKIVKGIHIIYFAKPVQPSSFLINSSFSGKILKRMSNDLIIRKMIELTIIYNSWSKILQVFITTVKITKSNVLVLTQSYN